jgi:indolepyruvate decarboxylase
MRTLATALLQGLKDHGAREMFGIPGDFVLPFFKAIEESNILPCFTFSHEPAVGFAADAAARYRPGIGVAVVTYGAGAFNIVNAIAGAYAERSPVVLIAGAPGARERTSGFMLHHQARSVDTQFAVLREVTCDQAVLTDAATAPAEIARVLRSARERSLPVYIELPRDMVGAECAAVPVLPRTPVDPEALRECAEEIVTRLSAAKRAAIIVDVEIRRYGIEEQVAELARTLKLPVVTTFMGRGLLNTRPTLRSAPISVRRESRVSRGWSRMPTRCCCSASSSPTPISLSLSACSTSTMRCWRSTGRCGSAITAIAISRSMH